jgi:hypothetical protein
MIAIIDLQTLSNSRTTLRMFCEFDAQILRVRDALDAFLASKSKESHLSHHILGLKCLDYVREEVHRVLIDVAR